MAFDLPTLDPSWQVAAPPPAPAAAPQGTAFMSGLKSGLYGTGAALAGAYQGAAKLAGADTLADRYGQTAAGLQASAAAAGRPDLEAQGFFGSGLGGFLSKAAYTAGQAAPQLAGAIGAGALATAALPEEGALAGGALVGRLGASLPKLLGGAGLGAGFAADAAPEALVAGARTVAAIGGAGGLMGVQSAGEQVNTAAQQPGGLTRGAAARAFVQGLPIGLIQGIAPGEGALLARGGESAGLLGLRGFAGGVADHALKNAAAGAVGSGLQAAADTSFDPNMTAGERASAIVQAAAGGAEAGGLLGAGFGLFARHSIPDQMAAVDQQLGAAGASPDAGVGATPPPSGPPQGPYTPGQARAMARSNGPQEGASPVPLDVMARRIGDLGQPQGLSAEDFTTRMRAALGQLPLKEAPAPLPLKEAPAEPQAPSLQDAVAAANADQQPQNGFVKDVLKALKINVGRGKGDFPEFVAQSTATNEAELHNELHAVDPTSSLADDKRFTRLADVLGVGDPSLDENLRRVLSSPTPDEAQAKALFFKVGIRDAALRLRKPEGVAQDRSSVPDLNFVSTRAPEERPAATPEQQAGSGPARGVVPPAATVLDADVPELAPAALQPEPAVKPPVEAVSGEQAQPSLEDIQQQFRDLIGGGTTQPGNSSPGATQADPASRVSEPKAITDRVLDAARDVVGTNGGEASIAEIRARLPDVAAKDVDAALREIHGDDSDNKLTQAPKGQRTGVDGVSVPGQGRFHNIEIEARDGGVQEQGAAGVLEGGSDAGAVRADGGADPGGDQITAAGQVQGTTEGQPGTPPASRSDFQKTLTRPEPTSTPADTRALLDPATYRNDKGRPAPYPGDDAMARVVGVSPDAFGVERREAGTAVSQRLKLLWQMGQRSSFDDRFANAVAEVRDSDGRRVPTAGMVRGEDGRPRLQDASQAMRAELQAHAATPDVESVTKAAVAPAEPPAAPSPVQQAAAEQITAAPAAATTPVKQALRKRTKVATSLLKTADGDQVPTAAVGGDRTEVPQATASTPDRLTTPVPKGSKVDPRQGDLGLSIAADPGTYQDFLRNKNAAASSFLSRDDVEQHVQGVVQRLSPDVRDRISVLGSGDEIPGSGVTMDGKLGVYAPHLGKVFVNGDMMRNRAQVEETISHEVFGHLGNYADIGGIGGTFDPDVFTRRFAQVFDRAGGIDGIRYLARQMGVYGPGDGGHNLGGGAGLKAYLPPDGTALTPFQKARIADELIGQQAGVAPSAVDRTVQTVQGRFRGAIASMLRRAGLVNFAKRFERFGPTELRAWVDQSRQALSAQPRPGDVDLLQGASTPRGFLFSAKPEAGMQLAYSLARAQGDSEGVMGAVDALRTHIQRNAVYEDLFGPKQVGKGVVERARDASRTIAENLSPADGIANYAQRLGMGGILRHFQLGETDRAIRTRLDGVGNRVAQDHLDVRSADPARGRLLDKVMDVATSNNLDPRRPFAEHTWLHDGRPPENTEALRKVHADLKKDYDSLALPMKGGRPSKAQAVFDSHVAHSQMNWYMSRAMSTFDALGTTFKDQVDVGYDPAKRYAGLDKSFVGSDGVNLANGMHGDVMKSRDYWRAEFERLNKAASDHAVGEGTREGNAGTRSYQDLQALVKNNTDGEAGYVKQGPYFRRGRSGDYAVGFKLPPVLDAEGNPTERPDAAALKAIQAGYARDFPQVSIGSSDTNRQVFARFPSEELARNFAAKVLEGGALRQHVDLSEGEPRVSLLAHAKETEGAVPFLQQHLDAARARFDAELARMPDGDGKTALAAQRDKYVGTIRSTIMDLSGDTSMRSVQSQRENAQGSNIDMLQNQKDAASTYARAVSTISTRADKADALFTARKAIDDAGRSGGKDPVAKSARMQRVYNAYEARHSAADARVDNTLLSNIKAGLHTYTLGASPAYMVMNMSQLGTLTLPELAKFHSFARAVPAMVGALPRAGRVLAAMVRTGDVVKGGITEDVLNRSGLSRSDRAYLTDMVNHDHIELGSYSAAESGRSVGDLEGRVARYMHYANSTALLAETAARLVTAFAAKDLHEGLVKQGGLKAESLLRQYPTALSYGGHVVGDSMLRWGSYNTPKLFTAGGAMGQMGPLVTQFHGFVPRIVEKVARESLDGFTKRLGNGPEAAAQRVEARRFVLAHLAAVTAISGGLGLPMAGYAAGVATRLSGAFLDQPFDFAAHIRDALANTFGSGMGEVLSRGLPRYLGVDMGDLGDEGWGPLSKLMESRQKLEDAVPEYATHAWGNWLGAGLNTALAARELMEGRFSEAGARALPTSMRNFVRAYRVSQYGYVNSVGERLPVPAGAAEVLKTALGMEGGQVAEEKERQEAVSGLKNDRAYREGLIKRDAAVAQSRGDSAGLSQALDAAQRYDQDNPGMSLSRQMRSDLVNKARATAFGVQTGTLGIDPKDRLAQSLAKF